MTKVGILTFHNNENRGALLQAYCLERAVEEVMDADVEVVDYRTRSKEINRRSTALASKDPREIYRGYRDRKITENFIQNVLRTSSESIASDSLSECRQWINSQGYDILISGSDEVWKVNQDSDEDPFPPRYPSRPFPNLYFLPDGIDSLKVSYAASANSTIPERLSDDVLERMARYVGSFDLLSVRDDHTEALLEEWGISHVQRVPDPTFLVDIPEKDVDDILVKQGIDPDSPILGVHGSDGELFRRICDVYRDRGFQVVSPRNSEVADVIFEGTVDPFEYYNLYSIFDMTLSNSLHSTIFSLQHGTPFATCDLSAEYGETISKTESLLKEFDMLDRHISAYDEEPDDIVSNVSALDTSLDETDVDNRIEVMRRDGRRFLSSVEEHYEVRD